MLLATDNPQRSAPDSDNRQKADQHAQTSNHQMQPNKRRMQPFRLHCQLLEKAKTTSGCPRLGLGKSEDNKWVSKIRFTGMWVVCSEPQD